MGGTVDVSTSSAQEMRLTVQFFDSHSFKLNIKLRF